ncbi:restriction endonuclease subunit S [Muribaculaceae bacterium Isolate-043 (Harlan)]|nr:restriction endonuclease subunit S [Muribaculaceae bacterium Isolate-043 (Harlan)]
MSCIHLLYCDKSHYQNFTPPFDIPESWQWVRLGDYVINRDGERVPIASTIRSKQSNKIYDYYGAAGAIDKVDNYIFDERLLLIGEDGANLLSRTKDNAFFADGKYWVNNHAHVLDSSDKFLLEFVALYINTIPLDDYITGSAQPKLSQDNLNNIHLPIPPIEEQRRILTMIESLMSIICEIRESKQQLSQSIALTKSKILDLAMQGKLVPQDPADEPAAEMLRRVNPKAKIITDNPQCRNLPLGWTLCQLRDLCSFLSRGKSPKYSETPNQYPVFAQKCNLKDGDISLTQARFLDENTISKWPEKYRLRDGDVLVNSTGTGTVGRTRMFKSEYLGNYPFVVPDSHVSVVRSFDEIDSTYIFYCLYCQDGQQYFAENLAGSTNQKELYIDVIGDKSIMLPPINEQKRIVAKIEEQYSVLYEIEASLRS